MDWIKVEDQLPKEKQEVWYYFEYTGVSRGFYTKYHWGPDVNNAISDCFFSKDGWLCDDVTHWMPYSEGDEVPNLPT